MIFLNPWIFILFSDRFELRKHRDLADLCVLKSFSFSILKEFRFFPKKSTLYYESIFGVQPTHLGRGTEYRHRVPWVPGRDTLSAISAGYSLQVCRWAGGGGALRGGSPRHLVLHLQRALRADGDNMQPA